MGSREYEILEGRISDALYVLTTCALKMINVDIGYSCVRVLLPDQSAGRSFQTCLKSKKLEVWYNEFIKVRT